MKLRMKRKWHKIRRGQAATFGVLALAGLWGAACGGGAGGQQNQNEPLGDGAVAEDGGAGGDAHAPDAGPPPPFVDADFFVAPAPAGSDDNPGTKEAPFATLGRARQAVRDRKASQGLPEGGLVVALRGGTYPLTETFTLGAEDSGDATAPVYWVGYPGEEARISGGVTLAPDALGPVSTSDPLWDRLPGAARDQILVADLGALGIDPGQMRRRGWGALDRTAPLEVVWGDQMLTLARWPNEDQTDPEDLTADAQVTGDLFGASTVFSYLGTTATGNADDGRPNYTATVGGTDYFLYHCTWEWGGATHRYWFLSTADPRTDPNCWPTGITSWLAPGTWPLPELHAFDGSASEAVMPRTRPDDFAEHGFLRIPSATDDTHFQLPGSRYAAWAAEADPWFTGLFYNFWADNTLHGSVDGSGGVTLDDAPSYGIAAGQPFFARNLPEELDRPGEYYVDFGRARLYVLPPAGAPGAEVRLTGLEVPLLEVQGAQALRFVDLTFELGRTRLVKVSDSDDVTFERVTFRYGGGDGIYIQGTRSGLERCALHDLGSQGVILTGGHRPSLTRGELFVRNSDIHHWARWDRTYRPAIGLSGCGHVVEHNALHDGPHAGILFSGNEHRIEWNRIERVVREASDAGAIYTGRDWGYRGNLIQHNLIRDIDSIFGGAVGIYLDDASSGITVFGNIIHHVTGLATLSGGGRDNLFENNVLVDASASAHATDRRARTSNHDFNADGSPDSWNLLGRLNVDFTTYWAHLPDGDPIFYQSDPWASAYPALAVLPNDWSQVQDSHWQDPEGSTFRNNITWRCGGLISEGTWGGAGATDAYAVIDPNLADTDPGFVDEAGGDLTLRADSPVFTTPGFTFEPIPFDQIGIEAP